MAGISIWWDKDVYQKERYLLAVWEREFLIPCSLLSSWGTLHTNTVRSCSFLASQYPEYSSWIISPLAWDRSVSPQLSCPQFFCFTPNQWARGTQVLFIKYIIYLKLLSPPLCLPNWWRHIIFCQGKKGKESKFCDSVKLRGQVVVVNTEFLHNQSFVETHVNGH